MKRLGAAILLVVAILLAVIALAMLSSRPGPAFILLLLALGCGAFAWRIDPKPPKPADIVAALPSTPRYQVHFKRSSIVGMSLLGAGVFWLMALGALAALHVPSPGWVALVIVSIPFLLLAWKALQAEYAFHVDARGIDHWRIGHLPWSAIDGIRMDAVTVKGTTNYSLVVSLRDPQRHADRLGFWRRQLLKRKGVIVMPLQFTDAQPLWLFEAATRHRSALQPPALTGWNGDAEHWAAVLGAAATSMQAPDALQNPAHLRLNALMGAMAGGWSPLDNPEVTRQRRELKVLRDRVMDQKFGELERATTERINSGIVLSETDIDTMYRNAERAAENGIDGQRMKQLEAELEQTAKRLARRQQIVAYFVMTVVAVLWIWAKFFK